MPKKSDEIHNTIIGMFTKLSKINPDYYKANLPKLKDNATSKLYERIKTN